MISQNSWPAIGDYDSPELLPNPTVPGTVVQLLGGIRVGPAGVVLLEVARRWNVDVEPLIPGHCWAYQPRDIRGSTILSNHASATAIDLNAPEHPMGTSPAATMTARQIVAARRIVAWAGGVVRWGGDYRGRKDPQHWEINVSPDDPRLARLADQIKRTPKPTPAPPIEKDDEMSAQEVQQITAAIAEQTKAIESHNVAIRDSIRDSLDRLQVAIVDTLKQHETALRDSIRDTLTRQKAAK